MNTTAKIQDKGQVTIPTSVRRLAGISKGDLVNFAFSRGQIVITPKVVIEHARFPSAGNDYTPAQRRVIDRGISRSEKEYKQGRSFGPFATHADFIAALHKEAAKLGSNKSKRSRP